MRRVLADPHVLLVGGIVPAAIGAAIVESSPALPVLTLFGGTLIGLQFALARPSSGVLERPSMRHTVRLIATLVFVGAVNAELGQSAAWPAVSLFLPVIALAAALGRFEALWVGLAAAVALVLPAFVLGAERPFDVGRGLVLAATAGLLTVGTRRAVSALEGSLERARRLISANRRRTAQLAAVDEVSRILATSGPTPQVLEGIIELFEHRLGYPWASIYLGDDRRVRMGAQVGYAAPILEFDGSLGVIGRTMRSRAAQYVPDVATDPDYHSVDDGVHSEICAPLTAGGDFLGLVNIEAATRLESDDLATVRLVADRIAAALALVREREALARRADLSQRIVDFAAAIAGTLEAPALYDAIVEGVLQVIEAPFASFAAVDSETGRVTLRAVHGVDERFIGGELRPGEGVTSRAIQTRAVVVDPRMERDRFPLLFRDAAVPDAVAAMAVPLIRNNVVVGGITLVRDADSAFDALEQETLRVLAGQAALALANAELLAQVTESSLRDPLTGLFNRRYLDATLERMEALRRRQERADRRPIAAILFDLDHFGALNKRHGHQVGDTVLRGFADILRERIRASDVVARYGGEEFLIVLEGAGRADAVRLAEHVRRRLASHAFEGADGAPVGVTVSAGVAITTDGDEQLLDLVRIADAGLAMAKRAGRDQVVAV